MVNEKKYYSLLDYSSKLDKAIGYIESFCQTHNRDTMPKRMKSFMVSLRSLQDMLDSIQKVQEMLEKVEEIPKLDKVASQDNKNARNAQKQINSIKSELSDNLRTLKEQYMEQLKLCYKQLKKIRTLIVNTEKYPDARKEFNSASDKFLMMAFSDNKYDIFSHPKTTSTTITYNQGGQKTPKLGEELDEALKNLDTILIGLSKDGLTEDVKDEVADIKKVLSPKVLSISQERLERLQHSEQLIGDLDKVQGILKNFYGFSHKDGKLQKINKKLESVKQLVVAAIKEEKRKKNPLVNENDVIQGRIKYATEAVKAYGEILKDNDRLDRTQTAIVDHTHSYYAENERSANRAKQLREEAYAIREKPKDELSWEDELKADKLSAEAKELENEIKKNNEEMDRVMHKQRRQIPPKYTDMKDKLKKISSLYTFNMYEMDLITSKGRAR